MIKNNIISLTTHLVMCFIAIALLETPMIINVFIGLLFGLTYIFVGYKFLIDLGSKRKNLLSVGLVCILSIVIWIICFKDTGYYGEKSYDHTNGFTWMLYYICTYAFSSMLYYVNNFILHFFDNMISDILKLYLSIMPSLFFFSGIRLQKRFRRTTQ